MSAFSRAEYDERFRRASALMEERKIDALLVTNVENVAYLCGSGAFDHSWAMQFMTPIAYATVVIVPRKGEPILIVHDVFEGVLHQGRTIDDVRVYYERGREEEQPYVQLTVEALEKLGCKNGSIGIELGAGYTTDPKLGMPLKNLLTIQKKLPDAKFVEGSEILRILRMVKSKQEIGCIKRATEIADKTFASCFDEMKEGMSETDVVTLCNRMLSEQGARPVWTLAMCEPTAVWNPRADAKLKKATLLFLDLGATYCGYHTDFNRMAVVGRPTDNQRKACDNIARITRATIESVKPGIRACDIVERCRGEFKKIGLEPTAGHETRGYGPHRKIGHGIGLTLSEAPQITTYDETVLKAGMTFCIEPPLNTDQGFYVTEQVVAVTDHGYEILSRADDQLYEI